ncbi:AbiJ-related protein [Belnapia rosea]|uniref:AbiJ-related protein n=1 Tax=Belnapia rosea TaxID=938405 RepID=UPI00087E8B24|nr:hypothetical protein [Belnapia rosea]SDB74335.1 hypothetical protein SAMN02927895_05159 [Belnapia rosea]
MSDRSSLENWIAEELKSRCTASMIAENAPAFGLELTDQASLSKRDWVLHSLARLPTDREVAEIALRVGQHFDAFWLEEAAHKFLEKEWPPIPEISRRDAARCFGYDLVGERDLLQVLNRVFQVGNLPTADIWSVRRDLAIEIHQHMVRNDDWNVEELFEKIGALSCSVHRFGRILEESLDPLCRRGDRQDALVARLNQVLRRDGYEMRLEEEFSGYPIHRFHQVSRGVSGPPKNLIFASVGPKPEIAFRDAINNDIMIRSHQESCLVYDRAIGPGGLLWSELAGWWRERNLGLTEEQARTALGMRLRDSLAPESDAERMLFDSYFKLYSRALGSLLPALVPQVYLHYDPAVVKQLKHREGLLRQRMDFLLLLPNRHRVVLKVDGTQHFSKNGKPSIETYAAMVAADRELRLSGYELFRFGANELVGQGATETIRNFGSVASFAY